MEINLTGVLKRRYGDELKGRQDWVNVISKEDRQALAEIAFAASGYGVLGGRERARTAERDSQGRFK